jgi:hypothetical protein
MEQSEKNRIDSNNEENRKLQFREFPHEKASVKKFLCNAGRKE